MRTNFKISFIITILQSRYKSHHPSSEANRKTKSVKSYAHCIQLTENEKQNRNTLNENYIAKYFWSNAVMLSQLPHQSDSWNQFLCWEKTQVYYHFSTKYTHGSYKHLLAGNTDFYIKLSFENHFASNYKSLFVHLKLLKPVFRCLHRITALYKSTSTKNWMNNV